MWQGSWAHADEESTFYELKANVENILRRVGMASNALVAEISQNNIFDKGLELKTRGGKTIVEMGILSHKLLKKMDISQAVFYADINWSELMKAIRKK